MAISLRPHIARMPVYKPGKPAQPGPDGHAYKLSSNENPDPPLPGVLDAVAAALAQGMNRYPDAANVAITELVAARHGLAPAHVAFGGGSVQVLAHLIQATCQSGDEVLYPWRSFEAYPLVVQATGATSVQVPLTPTGGTDLEALADAITPATRVVMVCTPNNPTGPAVRHDELSEFLARLPENLMVIIDEAYVEYVSDPDAARGLELLTAHPGAVSLRTFSKAYGLAGLRVGWCAAEDPAIAAAVRAVTMPFEVSVAAQIAVEASLAAEDELLARVAETVAERQRVLPALRELGFQVADSQANFVWLPTPDAETWFEAFRRAGLMTRAFAGEGIRITIAEPAANRRLLEVASQLRQ